MTCDEAERAARNAAARAMSPSEQRHFDALYRSVDKARTTLERASAGVPDADEDLRVACARLDNWLLENLGRWAA